MGQWKNFTDEVGNVYATTWVADEAGNLGPPDYSAVGAPKPNVIPIAQDPNGTPEEVAEYYRTHPWMKTGPGGAADPYSLGRTEPQWPTPTPEMTKRNTDAAAAAAKLSVPSVVGADLTASIPRGQSKKRWTWRAK